MSKAALSFEQKTRSTSRDRVIFQKGLQFRSISKACVLRNRLRRSFSRTGYEWNALSLGSRSFKLSPNLFKPINIETRFARWAQYDGFAFDNGINGWFEL